jgi:hypothetical protein
MNDIHRATFSLSAVLKTSIEPVCADDLVERVVQKTPLEGLVAHLEVDEWTEAFLIPVDASHGDLSGVCWSKCDSSLDTETLITDWKSDDVLSRLFPSEGLPRI